MSSNLAIVDDQDSAVRYSGQWIRQGAALEFNSTTSRPDSKDSTASFSFVGKEMGLINSIEQCLLCYRAGTAITVYATVSPGNGTLSFNIDGSTVGAYTTSSSQTEDTHHTPLWTSPQLSGDSHTLVITQDSEGANLIYLDYLVYTTSPNTPLDNVTYFVDGTDSRVQFSSGWIQSGSDANFNHTEAGSSAQGNFFYFSFQGAYCFQLFGLIFAEDYFLL